MLAEDCATFSPEKIAVLKMTVALGAIKRNHRETGLAMLRDLLKAPTALNAEGRGWAWRNISMALGSNDPEARHAAQLSADAFLQAGNKKEAAKSLMRLANLLMQEEPAEAVTALNEMVTVLDKEGIVNRYVRAAALHARANRLAMLSRHSDAYQDACEAVKLRRGLLGAEDEFVSALHLAAHEACHVGDETAAEAFETEAEKLTDEWKLPHFQLAQRVSRLAQAFDPNEAEKLLDEAEAAHNLEVIVAVRVLQASLDTSLSDTARLEILEKTRNRITAANGRAAALKPVQTAMAQRLAGMGQYQRAETWLREILVADPLDGFARNALIECLWRQEKWGDAAIFVRKQLTLRGELPGLTFALGRSLFEAGDLSGAVMTLTRLLTALGGDDNLRKRATELREHALQLGGTIVPARLPAPVTGPVTREELEAALDSFARFIAAEKRMRFWVGNKKGGHEWVKKPERLAQDLLHTFLKARFGERVEIFEEIATGAGRLDLYVRLEGGLSVIIELKMCGAPYSSAYAAVGEEQIQHYMDNRKTNLGYLVVFDGRIDLFGERLVSQQVGPHTVVEKIVDVRNRVNKKS
jgi:tetratricopeptide (TPR) repeat protein